MTKKTRHSTLQLPRPVRTVIDAMEDKKALDLLAKGKAVDYEGATGVMLTDVGEAAGSFLEKEIKGGKFKTKGQR